MTSDNAAAEPLFVGKGEMAARMRSLDWASTPLGTPSTFPQSLRSALSICLNSRFPIAIYWGKDCLLLYNDAWRPIVGDKHPWALGRPGQEVWAEIWDSIGPELAGVLATGEGTFHNDELLPMKRFGYTEECFFEYTFNPIQGQGGAIDGVFNVVSETTYRVLNDRRARLLREIASRTGMARTTEDACALMMEAIATDPHDIPFALLYLLDQDGQQARLSGGTESNLDSQLSPTTIDLTDGEADRWQIVRVAHSGQPQIIGDVESRFGVLPSPWAEVPQEAMVLPIAAAGSKVTGVLAAVASPRLRLDDPYRDFLTQVTGQVATAITNARAYEEESQRAEALAAIDRAKTIFFSNVSHEFRTPLTLMLSPLEELSNSLSGQLQPEQQEQLQLIQRNGLRLQKLVNTLLDFSRIEAGRVQASYEPTDLAAYTAELASVFRSLIEQAGMRLVIDCPTLPESVYIDREMWEKIVLNLVSNAFKFTFSGSITVQLKSVNQTVELSVADTGVGIAESELPRLFERFHRVSGSRSRTYEGSGIGLALVQELVKLHGGTIRVTSKVDVGTTFTIAIPLGLSHLPADRIAATRELDSTALGANPYIIEASRWLPSYTPIATFNLEDNRTEVALSAQTIQPTKSKIVLADDNADMRDYLKRLLSSQYTVEAVADGHAALNAIGQYMPDLVLTDVMMPGVDGFEVLRSLRSDPNTQEIPIILLSARAGEEARIEGLEAGADDYLIKPFSARELLARVEATLKLARIRKEAENAIREGERRLKLAVESGRMMAWEWHPFEGTIITANLTEIYGIDRIESAAQAFTHVHPEDRDRHQSTVENAVATGSSYYSEFRWIRPDNGVTVWLEERGQPIFNPDGSLQKLIGISIDIHDRQALEEQRSRLLKQEQAARIEAERANRIKDEFLAVVSHELRSPLNPILGWAKLLQQGKLDSEKAKRALAIIDRNAQLQAQLIDDLLDISRILRGKLSLNVALTDLSPVIAAAMDTLRLAAEAKSIDLQFDPPDRPIPVLGDGGRLQQVIWNLLSNAVKFTPDGGQVTVTLSQHENHAQIQVQDTGKGIHPDFLPYVFEHFRQEDSATTRKFGGLGLGLAIARQIVELHGGQISVDSPGEKQGATFTIQIPIAAIVDALADSELSPVSIHDLNQIRIFVVDDETDSREFITFVLEQEGAIVTAFSSGSEILQALERETPMLIISDIGMPEMDGYMLLKYIRTLETAQYIPAIALTAYASEIDRQQALQVGFQRHLSKPIEPGELIQAIGAILQPIYQEAP
jgi:PAS domain S-box-containing protein